MNQKMRAATVVLPLALGLSGCGLNALGLADEGDGCSEPAPLLGQKTEAPGYIVAFRAGTNATRETARLAERYGFTPRHVYTHALLGFSAELTDAALAGVRCAATVESVEHNGIATIG